MYRTALEHLKNSNAAGWVALSLRSATTEAQILCSEGSGVLPSIGVLYFYLEIDICLSIRPRRDTVELFGVPIATMVKLQSSEFVPFLSSHATF